MEKAAMRDDPPPSYADTTGAKPESMAGKENEALVADPWALIEPKNPGKKWKEMDCGERCQSLLVGLVKVVVLLGLLYMFICSLDFLSNAFKLLGGKSAGQAFQNNAILSNPVAGLMIGVLATVLVQSSSTSTSIVVSMVAAGFLQVKPAIFIVMGANIGTSVTNTIVALGQAIDTNEFRRAFGGATVHDMFNWLSVIIFLPLEAIVGEIVGCGPLCLLTDQIVRSLNLKTTTKEAKKDLLKVITKPFTKLVIQLDKKAINSLGNAEAAAKYSSFIKHKCSGDEVLKNVTATVVQTVNNTNVTVNVTQEKMVSTKEQCVFMFEWVSRPDGGGWSDTAVGVVLLIIALALLCICLFLIVKLLHSMLQGHIAVIIKKVMNANFPGPFKYVTGYIVILVGAGLTILVQSSSIFTSAITPLVGIGVLSIDRMYPLTLGANIGTTFTAVLAALASDVEYLDLTLQVALCHLFFNIFGILIFYPIPFMRIPIPLAKRLGDITAKYKWFAIVYLLIMFLIFPGVILGLSIAGWMVLVVVGGIFLVFFVTITVINVLQVKKPHALPKKLQNWEFLPKPLHSLQPYDRVMSKLCSFCKCCRNKSGDTDVQHEFAESKKGEVNPTFTPDMVASKV